MNALEARRDEFIAFERALCDDVSEASARLRSLGERASAEVIEAAGAPASRVTFPSDELDARRGVVVPFEQCWRSHEEARSWALGVLKDRVTFAADGSQIFPGREFSMPVGAVQVASFENKHTAEGMYTKDAHLEVITPGELLRTERQYESPEQIVSLKRFELEAQTICRFLERKSGWRERGERMPLAFLDGTLLISSARQHTQTRFFEDYAKALVALVRLSGETQVPVVGYIDQSYAPDLRDLLEALDKSLRQTIVYDAQMLRAHTGGEVPLLAQWGDRTIFWHCQRTNLAESFYDESGQPLVGFVYMQATGDGAPARLDIPVWVQGAGLLEEVLDAVRAECVVGNGYPYAIETADEAAVMSGRDREQFLHVMQEFAESNSFAFRVSRKAVSKGRRR
ncbi:MAG: DNA double-strand break repair nuclease NurA [Acidobacteria bacterium]|nr:DNA double-strand break repair nuclease NurA [Acidobacteriota bacterium]